jgi:hypothetical protein
VTPRNDYQSPRASASMDRQQIIAIILVLLMVGSSVVYGAALVF